jgi:hypothetical protein
VDYWLARLRKLKAALGRCLGTTLAWRRSVAALTADARGFREVHKI